MSLFRHIASGFRFSVKQFSSAEFGICCAYFTRTAEELIELSISVLLQNLAKLRLLQGTELSVKVVICSLGSF